MAGTARWPGSGRSARGRPHTSGSAYEVWDAGIARFNADRRFPSSRSGLRRGLELPLAFDPGTGWAYGMGLDWAGLLIEAVDGRGIDVFCREEIFGPLGMAETVFAVPPALEARLAGAWLRTAAGLEPVAAVPVARPEFWGMGHCLVGTGADYLRFLRMLLGGGALGGVRLLSEAAVAALMAPQTGPLGPMPSTDPAASAEVWRIGAVVSHSLLGNRLEVAIPGRRAAGAQSWAGLYNTHWWLDPARGRAGLFLTQLRPFWDVLVMAAFEAWERAVHDL